MQIEIYMIVYARSATLPPGGKVARRKAGRKRNGEI